MATTTREDQRRDGEGEEPGTTNSWVNEGYNAWVRQRNEWTKAQQQQKAAASRSRTAMVSTSMVLGDKPFPKPVPLEAVIECLVEIWEDEDGWD